LTEGLDLPTIRIPVDGTVLSEMRAVPDVVDFGTVDSAPMRSAVTIASARARPFKLISATGDESVTAQVTRPNVEPLVVGVAFSPRVVGYNVGKITLVVEDADQHRTG
jgi:hypothetical protein